MSDGLNCREREREREREKKEIIWKDLVKHLLQGVVLQGSFQFIAFSWTRRAPEVGSR